MEIAIDMVHGTCFSVTDRMAEAGSRSNAAIARSCPSSSRDAACLCSSVKGNGMKYEVNWIGLIK
jgi:hypothetical protein